MNADEMILYPPKDPTRVQARAWPTKLVHGYKYIGYWVQLLPPKPEKFHGTRYPAPPPLEQRIMEWEEECAIIGSYPDPHDFVGDWNAREKTAVLTYLENTKLVFASWRGYSFCRFYHKTGDSCAAKNEPVLADGEPLLGTKCFTDGEWVWPEGLAHYVRQHSVVLPRDFIDKAIRHLKAAL